MTADELVAYRQRLGKTSWEMSALLGADHRRYRRWERGEFPVGLYVNILLPLMVKIAETPEYAALVPDAFVGATWGWERGSKESEGKPS